MAVNINTGLAGSKETKLNRAFWSRSNKIALSRVTALPISPSDGDIYIIPDDDLTNPNKIAFWSDIDDDWLLLTPEEGWICYIADEALNVQFDGTNWGAFNTNSSSANGVSFNASPTDNFSGDDVQEVLEEVDAIITDLKVRTIFYVIDGGGSAITTGIKGYLPVDFACTIIQAEVLADQSGSIVIDVWKDSYANYPPTVADTITASAKPTLSSAIKSQDATLTGWTTPITAGDVLGFNVDSATTVTRVTVTLKVRIN